MQAVNLVATHQALGDLPAAEMTAIVSAFETDIIRLVQEMDGACERRDVATLRFAAQSLAGVSATFGAQHLAALARQVIRSCECCGTELLDAVKAEASYSVAEIKQAFSAHGV